MPLWPQAAAQSRNGVVIALRFERILQFLASLVAHFWAREILFNPSRGCKSILKLAGSVRFFASRLALATFRMVSYGEATYKAVHQLGSCHALVSGKLQKGAFKLTKWPRLRHGLRSYSHIRSISGDCID